MNTIFGKIVNAKMQLNELGQFMEDNILNLQSHYLYAAINSHQVMPNHIHLIVSIDTNGVNVPDVLDDPDDLDDPVVETGRAPSLQTTITASNPIPKPDSPSIHAKMQLISQRKG
jgi:hypothetical protein